MEWRFSTYERRVQIVNPMRNVMSYAMGVYPLGCADRLGPSIWAFGEPQRLWLHFGDQFSLQDCQLGCLGWMFTRLKLTEEARGAGALWWSRLRSNWFGFCKPYRPGLCSQVFPCCLVGCLRSGGCTIVAVQKIRQEQGQGLQIRLAHGQTVGFIWDSRRLHGGSRDYDAPWCMNIF